MTGVFANVDMSQALRIENLNFRLGRKSFGITLINFLLYPSFFFSVSIVFVLGVVYWVRTNLFTHSVNPTRHLNVFTLHRIAMLLPVNGGESRRNFFFFQRGVADLSQEKKRENLKNTATQSERDFWLLKKKKWSAYAIVSRAPISCCCACRKEGDSSSSHYLLHLTRRERERKRNALLTCVYHYIFMDDETQHLSQLKYSRHVINNELN